MYNFQIHCLINKTAITNKTKVVFRLSANMIGNFYDKINFSHESLLTNKQVSNLQKVFANNSPTDIKLWKAQLSKMIQSGWFLGRLTKNWIAINKKYVIKPLAKNVLILLGLSAAADAGIIKKL